MSSQKNIFEKIKQKVREVKINWDAIKKRLADKKAQIVQIKEYRKNTTHISMKTLDDKFKKQQEDVEKEVVTITSEESSSKKEHEDLEEAKTVYDDSVKVEEELKVGTKDAQKEEASSAVIELEEKTAEKEEKEAEEGIVEEDKVDIEISKKEEEIKEKKIVAEENAANA